MMYIYMYGHIPEVLTLDVGSCEALNACRDNHLHPELCADARQPLSCAKALQFPFFFFRGFGVLGFADLRIYGFGDLVS